jgi:hypothetical protein
MRSGRNAGRKQRSFYETLREEVRDKPPLKTLWYWMGYDRLEGWDSLSSRLDLLFIFIAV